MAAAKTMKIENSENVLKLKIQFKIVETIVPAQMIGRVGTVESRQTPRQFHNRDDEAQEKSSDLKRTVLKHLHVRYYSINGYYRPMETGAYLKSFN